LFNGLMEEHHYLGHEQPVGEHLKYLLWAQGWPVVYDADPHLPVMWRQLVRLSDGVVAPYP
jgi:hypothetical protein